MGSSEIDGDLRSDVETLWAYHDTRHQPSPRDVGIALGSRDLDVPIHAAEMFRQGMFPT